MFTNDIVGSSLGQNGVRDPNSVRLFAVGPYFDETPQEAADRRTTGSENDSPARQLARYAKDVAHQAPTDMSVRIVYKRDRYLRGGDHIPFSTAATRRPGSRRSTRTTATSTRTCAWRTAPSSATCWTSSTSAT